LPATGTQALLLGSGVSRSAQVPTGWDVTLDLVRRVALIVAAGLGREIASGRETYKGSTPPLASNGKLVGARIIGWL
jgi:hypothetical protein